MDGDRVRSGKLERLCRYVSRPAVPRRRLALTERGDQSA
ncbi:MAG TPA: transposase [Gammaproteobacteria bacterium]|nr:transposase [Gammaproteobacteria bacterium]